MRSARPSNCYVRSHRSRAWRSNSTCGRGRAAREQSHHHARPHRARGRTGAGDSPPHAAPVAHDSQRPPASAPLRQHPGVRSDVPATNALPGQRSGRIGKADASRLTKPHFRPDFAPGTLTSDPSIPLTCRHANSEKMRTLTPVLLRQRRTSPRNPNIASAQPEGHKRIGATPHAASMSP